MHEERNIQELLQNIGLNEKEAAIYMELLKLNGSYPTILAKHCKINRSSIYVILDSLVERGIIYRTHKNAQFYYFATQPSDFIKETREHQNLIQQTLDDLENLLEDLANENPFKKNTSGNRVITDLEQALDYTAEMISNHITNMAAIFLVDWDGDKIVPYKFTKSRTADFTLKRIVNLRNLETPIMIPVNNIGRTAKNGNIMSGTKIVDFICPTVSKEFAMEIQRFGRIESLISIPIKINDKTIAVALLAFNKKQNKKKNIQEILKIINEGGIKIYQSLLLSRQRNALQHAIKMLKAIVKGQDVPKKILKEFISELEKELKATKPD